MSNQDKCYVTMTDRFMSGWGKAEGKINKLVISCNNLEEAEIVKENAQSRGDMKNINIVKENPYYSESKYYVNYHGIGQDDYKNWFKKGYFDPKPQMTKREIKDSQRNFMNIATIFTKPTGAINQKLHDHAINERLIRFCKLQNTGLTAKQIEDFTFKLTDAEKLSILSKASNKAPLRRDHGEEMQRLFYKVYGKEVYNQIFNAKPPEKEQWVNIWGNK